MVLRKLLQKARQSIFYNPTNKSNKSTYLHQYDCNVLLLSDLTLFRFLYFIYRIQVHDDSYLKSSNIVYLILLVLENFQIDCYL